MTLSWDRAYRSFGGEVEASSTPTICRLPDSRRHQLSAIALRRLAQADERVLGVSREKHHRYLINDGAASGFNLYDGNDGPATPTWTPVDISDRSQSWSPTLSLPP